MRNKIKRLRECDELRRTIQDLPLASLILFIFSCAFLCLFWDSWKDAYSYLLKSQVVRGTARIEESRVRWYQNSATQGGGAAGTAYTVRYTYSVAGKEYSSTALSFSQGKFIGTPQLYVEKYPIGSTATVYYLKNNPNIAALERQWGGGQWIFPSLLVLIIGALMSWFWTRRYLYQRAREKRWPYTP